MNAADAAIFSTHKLKLKILYNELQITSTNILSQAVTKMTSKRQAKDTAQYRRKSAISLKSANRRNPCKVMPPMKDSLNVR